MSKVKGRVRGIVVDWVFSGSGGVNFDSPDQKYYWKRIKGASGTFDNNQKFHKGNYYSAGDDSTALVKKLCVSPDFIRHHMFEEEHPNHPQQVASTPELFHEWITKRTSVLRGYLITDFQGASYKRASAISIPSAEQSSADTISIMSVGSKSGERSDTSFRFTETFGDIEYRLKGYGFINTDELQFISSDMNYDRPAFCEDRATEYLKGLENSLGSSVGDVKFYKKVGAAVSCEKGIVLSNDQVVDLVKYALKKMLTFSVRKAGGCIETKSLRIRFVTDEDPMSRLAKRSEDEFKDITSMKDIDDLNFDVYESYAVLDELSITKFLAAQADSSGKLKQRKDDKDKEKKEKAEKKAAKTGSK